MKLVCAMGVVGLVAVVGFVTGAPVPTDTGKPAAFPVGRYVLGGEKDSARGRDVLELTKTFRLKPGQYVFSGGPSPTDVILVDDDLEILQGDRSLFIDDDNVRSTENLGKQPARYQGFPIVLILDASKKVQVRATDCNPSEAILGPIWLHRWDGARKKLTAGKSEESVMALPHVFFDESFDLIDGFEMPKRVSYDAATDLPAVPASLLPRFLADK